MSGRKIVTVSVPTELRAQARALGVNMSEVTRKALAEDSTEAATNGRRQGFEQGWKSRGMDGAE